MFDLSTGASLRLLRIRYGMTQAELGKKVGVRPPTIHTWEVRRALGLPLQQRLTRIFGEIAAARGEPSVLDPSQEAGEIDRAYAQLLHAAEELYRVLQRMGRASTTLHPRTLSSLLVQGGGVSTLPAVASPSMGAIEDDEVADGGRHYQRLTPTERARNAVIQRQETERLRAVAKRNERRDKERAQVADFQRALKRVHAEQPGSYAATLEMCEHARRENALFVKAFLEASALGPLPDDSPLVTLPLEPLE